MESHTDPNSSCPVAEAIDLGLPSGTKWASWNVGASKPEEYGGYYAWGETVEKARYDWSTYEHCDGTKETCHDIGEDIAGTKYDVAHVKWGGSWRMPSEDQFDELENNCTREWTSQNGVEGTLFTGPNGNTIFLPKTGLRQNYDHKDRSGHYWSSLAHDRLKQNAYCLEIGNDYMSITALARYYGFSVRPVCP
jgi:hypothetical protein